jgi:endonuclease/exonuclease/phosphatase family metal-dependent hydrolase
VVKVADRIILGFNILAVAALLFSYLAPVVNPSRFFAPALFGLAYPYLFLLNLVLVCYWLIRLKKEILLSLLAILLGWNHLVNLLPLNLKTSEIPATIPSSRLFRVLSFNVRAFDRFEWDRDPDTRGGIFGFIEGQEPDILCFQEYYSSEKRGQTRQDIAGLLRSLPESAVYYTTDPANRRGLGIATFSRYPIVKQSRIPFHSVANAAMYTDIVFREDTIRVFNVHLQSIRFRRENYAFMDTVRITYNDRQLREIRDIGSQLRIAFARRAEQADMISNYISESPYPVILAGDFNDTPHSYAYRKIRKGLMDSFRKAGRGFGNTYVGDLPSFRIDFILYSAPLVPFDFTRMKAVYSDHYPVACWFYLP